MWIVEQVFWPGDRRVGQAILLEAGRQFACTERRKTFAQQRQQPRPCLHAQVVAGQLRVCLPGGPPELLAKQGPLRVAHRRQEDLVALLHGEHVVQRPGADAAGHGRGRLARDGVLHHVLRHQQHVVLEQRALHLLAAARAFALGQRGHRTDGAEHAAHDVVHARASPQRAAFRARHVGQAPHHLHHLVQRGAVLVGAGQEALERHVHQPRVQLRQRLPAQPHALQRARLEVLAEDIGLRGQTQHDLPSARALHIHRQAALVAVELTEEAGTRAHQPPRGVTLQGLHLDHLGTQVRQDHAAGGPHHHVRELHHAHAGKGQVLGG